MWGTFYFLDTIDILGAFSKNIVATIATKEMIDIWEWEQSDLWCDFFSMHKSLSSTIKDEDTYTWYLQSAHIVSDVIINVNWEDWSNLRKVYKEGCNVLLDKNRLFLDNGWLQMLIHRTFLTNV